MMILAHAITSLSHAIPLVVFPLLLGCLLGSFIGLGIGANYFILQMRKQLTALAIRGDVFKKATVFPRVLFAIIAVVSVVLFFLLLFSGESLLDSQAARLLFVLFTAGFAFLIILLCIGISLATGKIRRGGKPASEAISD